MPDTLRQKLGMSHILQIVQIITIFIGASWFVFNLHGGLADIDKRLTKVEASLLRLTDNKELTAVYMARTDEKLKSLEERRQADNGSIRDLQIRVGQMEHRDRKEAGK